MSLDPFYLKTEKETSDMLKIFWEDTEYLMKIRILLKIFEGYSITKLEARNINKLWKSLSLEKQKDVYQSQHKYQI
ncbi:hypothetical protein ES695_02060 [Candidatus Atribacteria bacterium 1244-E10-H5-B2]|jgi:hypothetical protein|nr:MAG: hypothetical protein ES695_02060 [Candidatus Atribacteria bacterium 1244-E10-H5-B2]